MNCAIKLPSARRRPGRAASAIESSTAAQTQTLMHIVGVWDLGLYSPVYTSCICMYTYIYIYIYIGFMQDIRVYIYIYIYNGCVYIYIYIHTGPWAGLLV